MLYFRCGLGQKFLLGYGKTLVGAHANLFLIIKGPYGKDKLIDKSYYTALVDEARKDIDDMVDVEVFLSDTQPEKNLGPTLDISEPMPEFMNIPIDADTEIPWDEVS